MKDGRVPVRNEPSAGYSVLQVRVQPRASKNGITRAADGALKIRLTAPPVDNAANEALIRFLADTFSVAKSQIGIVSGHTSRHKVVWIQGISQTDADRVLNKATE